MRIEWVRHRVRAHEEVKCRLQKGGRGRGLCTCRDEVAATLDGVGAGDDLTALESLRDAPWQLLAPSVSVDLVRFCALLKPAARFRPLAVDGIASVSLWCDRWGFEYAADAECYICVSRDVALSAEILEIDRRPDRHEIALGRLLGYPDCCCDAVSRVGESAIDGQAELAAGWSFRGPFRKISPSGYTHGRALISHIPCGPACEPSLAMANVAADFVLSHPTERFLRGMYDFTQETL